MIRQLALILLMPIPAFADVVSIRSGEHEDFSRLVLSIVDGTSWSIDQIDEGYRLFLDGHTDGFDISEVFERIPRTRLEGLEQVKQDSLDLQLSCACSIETFLWRSDRLVLDIIDAEEMASGVEPVLMTVSPDLVMLQSDDLVVPDVSEFIGGLSLTDFRVTPQIVDQNTSEQVNLSEAALLEGIARAASQGFLVPNLQNLSVEPMENAERVEPKSEPLPLEQMEFYSDSPLPGVDISTALDRNLEGLGSALLGSMGQSCLPAELFEIENWGDGTGLYEQVAALSDVLAGEFGEEPVEAETDLARLYLHFGFGAEALVALSITQTASQSRQVLIELASLFDERETSFPLLASQRHCETAGAFWAFIAMPQKPETNPQANDIMKAFFQLPQPLRGHIAPRLSEAFLAAEMPDRADQVLRSTGGSDAEHDPDVQAARAFVAEQNNDPKEALALLSDQANDSARLSPRAAIRLVNLKLDSGEVPTEPDLILLQALAVEFDGHNVSDELRTTEALGWAARGEFGRALGIVEGGSVEADEQIVDAIYLQLVESGSSGVFLDLALNERPDDLSDITENAIARRLIQIGFSDHALQIMTGSGSRTQAAERRYLRAEASLNLEDYLQAIDVLQGMTDERSRSLRAAAYSGLGDYRNAIEALDAGENASTPNLQFRAEAWERLTLEDDPVLSGFAKSVISENNLDATATLADRQSLLAQSQESRRTVEDLLLRFDGTPSPDE
ncbi:hypothetical protein N9O61_03720 [Octadecabacter sp.]|nr:hypothetical protein [Octadecabacter sp.]